MTSGGLVVLLRLGVFITVTTALLACTRVNAEPPRYVIDNVLWIDPIDVQKRKIQPSYSSALSACEDMGGVLPTFGTDDRFHFVENAFTHFKSARNFAFLGVTAEPPSQNATCTEAADVQSCVFRFTLGYNDQDTYGGLPGSGFFRDPKVAKTTDDATYRSHLLNGYKLNQAIWLNIPGSSYMPRGYFYLLMMHDREAPSNQNKIVDSKHVNDKTITTASENFGVVCEVQLHLAEEVNTTTTQLKQPVFRQTWKTLTWAQTYWWVIFALVGGVGLAVLLFVVLYCCCTRKQSPPGPPVYSMVIRERGSQLVTTQDSLKPSTLSGEQSPDTARHGHGFNMNPLQTADGVDGMQRRVSVYNTGSNAMIYNGGDSRTETKNMVHMQSSSPSAPTDNARGSQLGRRRSNTRRMGRTMSSTFSEVEVPEGDEVHEEAINI